MANLSEYGNHTAIRDLFCRTGLHGSNQNIFFAVLKIILAIITFVGNVLIIVALQKESSLNPPPKLLFVSLASTDLCVGFIVLRPLLIVFLTSPDHSERCRYLAILVNCISVICPC